ncbi:hypothetical protein V6478_003866 [Providencia rettgeri]|uniref:hypothetical protein n=1 Tax=Providencia TaxID=586 RepID=UPI000D7DC80E|nr:MULTISPECIES: hypothetical protein [Providencia]AWS52264.1 hypothetical protein AM461_16280 [Providencia rettgeri]EJD6475181.1 hypothetical protein [Providencia rettgeri]ELR5057019.1 hypothetical protein [Providencia rettgeri]ELR5066484.1 hypothetical protein [Providencia rettgeri]ELR5085915.1 hypothetical protein [Providencia rettgeri]
MDATNKLYKKAKYLSKRASAFAATLASYTVINGLVWFFGIRVSCKYPDYTNIAEHFCSIIIVLMFMAFITDFLTNYVTPDFLKLKEKTVISGTLYLLSILGFVLILWMYITSIYQPLFSFSKEIYQCTR